MAEDFFSLNQMYWNERVATHARSPFYDVESFKTGRSTLDEFEREAVGDPNGRSLLHLQCHFGMDTLSWARLGANATGIDFSGEAVALARTLSTEIGVPARFIQTNLYDLPDVLDERFDIVFTSYGTIVWLPDIQGWANIVARYLKPGGRFVFIDSHPAAWPFDYELTDRLGFKYDYFQETPILEENAATYADEESQHANTRSAEWNHTLGAILNALIGSGLRIEWLREYPVCAWRYLPLMEKGADGWWRLPAEYPSFPFLLSIGATK